MDFLIGIAMHAQGKNDVSGGDATGHISHHALMGAVESVGHP